MTLSVVTHLHYVISSEQNLDLELFIITNYLWFGNLAKLMDNLTYTHVKCYSVVVDFCRIGPF